MEMQGTWFAHWDSRADKSICYGSSPWSPDGDAENAPRAGVCGGGGVGFLQRLWSPPGRPAPNATSCAQTGAGEILAGAGRRSVLPAQFEIANVHYLAGTDCDPVMAARFGVAKCGDLLDEPKDCGTGGLCAGDAGYPGADPDGTERDGQPDWFHDCGVDRICPDNIPETDNPGTGVDGSADGIDNVGDGVRDDGVHVAPDLGERDGLFQAAWIAGFGNSRPAIGVHEDIDVRCLALRFRDTTAVSCSLDAEGFFNEEVERVREKLRLRHSSLDVDYLDVSSTHTHEAVDTLGQWGFANPIPLTPGRLLITGPAGELLYDHNAFVVDKIVAAAAEAVTSLRPARITMSQGGTGAAGFIRDSMDPQIIGDTLTVAEARTKDGDEVISAPSTGATTPRCSPGTTPCFPRILPGRSAATLSAGSLSSLATLPGRAGAAWPSTSKGPWAG